MFQKINRLAIKLYSGCNMNCSYCFQTIKEKITSPQTFTDFENLLKFLETLEYDNRVIVTFCGGEMTLKPDLIKECQHKVFRKLERIFDVKFIYAIITNGTNIDTLFNLFDDNILNPSFCNLSWDGLYSASKSRFCSRFTDEYFNNVIKKIGESDYNKSLSVVHSLTPSTIKYLSDSFKYCLDNNVLSLGYYPIHEANYDDSFHDIFREQLIKIYQYIIDAFKDKKDVNFFNLEYMKTPQDKAFFTCKKLGFNYYINPKGEIYPCIYFGDKGLYKFGNIIDGIDNNILEAFKTDYLHYPRCDYKKCKCSFCGECPAACMAHNGNMNYKFQNLCKIRQIEQQVFNMFKDELATFKQYNKLYSTEDMLINEINYQFKECDLLNMR